MSPIIPASREHRGGFVLERAQHGASAAGKAHVVAVTAGDVSEGLATRTSFPRPRARARRCPSRASRKRRLTSSESMRLSKVTFAVLSHSSSRIDGSSPALWARWSLAALSRRAISSVSTSSLRSSSDMSCLLGEHKLLGERVEDASELEALERGDKLGVDRVGSGGAIRRPPSSWSCGVSKCCPGCAKRGNGSCTTLPSARSGDAGLAAVLSMRVMRRDVDDIERQGALADGFDARVAVLVGAIRN